MSYQVIFEKSALKALQKLDNKMQTSIIDAIEDLSNNPRPFGYKKLKGRPSYRIRIGDYRVLYMINDKQVTVLIIDIGNRKEIYG